MTDAAMELDTDPENNNDIDFGDGEDEEDEWNDANDGDGWGDENEELHEIDANTMQLIRTDIDPSQTPMQIDGNNNSNNNNGNILSDGSSIIATNNNSHKSGMAGVQHRIPKITTDALTSNCIEINMIPTFVAKADLKSRSRIGALIGIRINQLTNLTPEQLEVWGITSNFKFIVLKFEFGVFYLNEAEAPSLQVGLSEKLQWEEPLKQFRLAWTIGERIKNSLLSNSKWPPSDIQLKDIPNATRINELMESTQKEYSLCLQALIECKFDASNALNMLLDESQCNRLNKKLKSIDQSQIEFEQILSKINLSQNDNESDSKMQYGRIVEEYETVDDTKKIKQLCDMFGISLKVAKFAFNTYGYDDATIKLADPSERDAVVAMATSVEEANKTTINTNNNKDSSNADTSDVNKVSDFLQNYTDGGQSGANDSGKKSGFASKVKNLFTSPKDSGNNNNSSNKPNDFVEYDEKLPSFESLGLIEQIKRTESSNAIQQCSGANITRSITRMLKHNWLLRILCFALKVLLNGNKFCMICDKPLEFAGLKPSICDKPFCQFRHDEMELGFSLCDELIHRPQLTDLFISMMHAACKTNRYQDFFPSGVRADTINIDTSGTSSDITSANNSSDVNTTTNTNSANNNINNGANSGFGSFMEDVDSFMTNGTADPLKVIAVIDACPEVTELKDWAEKGKKYLKQKCFETHPLLYHFLCWVITSNRSHLKLLKEEERIKDIDTPYQFALCSSTPQREAQFQRLQYTNGSFLAWHGSGFGNWHSILRMGLKNYSGTKHQLNGAAYGPGIYLGSTFNLSWGYCRNASGYGWSKSQYGTSVNCMALCEVCYHENDASKHKNANKSASAININSLTSSSSSSSVSNSSSTSSKSKSKSGTASVRAYNRGIQDPNNRWVKTSGIYVVDSEEHVITRFFFIFANAKAGAIKTQNANDLTIPKVVKSFD